MVKYRISHGILFNSVNNYPVSILPGPGIIEFIAFAFIGLTSKFAAHCLSLIIGAYTYSVILSHVYHPDSQHVPPNQTKE